MSYTVLGCKITNPAMVDAIARQMRTAHGPPSVEKARRDPLPYGTVAMDRREPRPLRFVSRGEPAGDVVGQAAEVDVLR